MYKTLGFSFFVVSFGVSHFASLKMTLGVFNYSLFITVVGLIFVAFRICNQSVPIEMSVTSNKAMKFFERVQIY